VIALTLTLTLTLGIIAGLLVLLILQGRVLLNEVRSLRETQMLVFEALERELKRLEKRVKEVEDVVL
jgi:hypothetical protein